MIEILTLRIFLIKIFLNNACYPNKESAAKLRRIFIINIKIITKGLIKETEPSEVLLLTYILSECSENDDAKSGVAKSIGKMREKHLLKAHSKE